MDKGAELIDYSTVTNKNTLVKRILELQTSIQEKQASLESESNMRSEF